MTAATAAERIALYNKRLHDDFKFFLSEVWRAWKLPALLRVQNDIADFLQHGPPRLIVEGFRGLAKTWITTAFCLWRLFEDPKNQITLSSASEGLSLDTLFMMREWIDLMPFLRHMTPQAWRRDAAKKFDIAGAPIGDRTASVRAIGITGALPGGRATDIVVDDAETPENAMTHFMALKEARTAAEIERDKKGEASDYLAMTEKQSVAEGREVYDKLPTDTQAILKLTGLTTLRVKPATKTGWKMNEKVFAEYKAILAETMPTTVSLMTSNAYFPTLPVYIQRGIVEKAIELAQTQAEIKVRLSAREATP